MSESLKGKVGKLADLRPPVGGITCRQHTLPPPPLLWPQNVYFVKKAVTNRGPQCVIGKCADFIPNVTINFKDKKKKTKKQLPTSDLHTHTYFLSFVPQLQPSSEKTNVDTNLDAMKRLRRPPWFLSLFLNVRTVCKGQMAHAACSCSRCFIWHGKRLMCKAIKGQKASLCALTDRRSLCVQCASPAGRGRPEPA